LPGGRFVGTGKTQARSALAGHSSGLGKQWQPFGWQFVKQAWQWPQLSAHQYDHRTLSKASSEFQPRNRLRHHRPVRVFRLVPLGSEGPGEFTTLSGHAFIIMWLYARCGSSNGCPTGISQAAVCPAACGPPASLNKFQWN
jgi:hypothetical protein